MTPPTIARAALRGRRPLIPLGIALAASTSACSAPLSVPEATDALVAGVALLALALAFVVGRHVRRPPPHRWDRHIALNLPQLAPERYCACGRCGQLAAPGAVLADWHYD